MVYSENSWRVELHTHLVGSCRPSTILEIAKARGIELPSSISVSEFAEFARVKQPGTLAEFLKNFPLWINVLAGDGRALRRIAYEFVEDCARQRIAYVETRADPVVLAGGDLTEDEVMSLFFDGFKEAEEKFGTKCNLIISMVRDRPDQARLLFEVAKRYFGRGVVGIDIVGNEALNDGQVNDDMKGIFREAEQLGINRTAHAGENGPAKCVETAVIEMKAQRIGHGYRVVRDEVIYKRIKEMNVHFETCPFSSILTGGAPSWNEHPIIRFCKDKVNYSLNTDDTLLTGKTLSQEYDACHEKLGLDAGEIVRCNFNAAKSSFLPKEEKEGLLKHMRQVLNLD